ncbi:MAG: ATP-grasp domain-containing protein, partial [Spirochaetales bacterium]|nr:ATP-grasp domain-containing protein [Spirochaetales bacterium]
INRIHCFDELDQLLNIIQYPILIKPVDLTGGKGVQICKSKEELIAAYNECAAVTRKNYVIIEEYIEGSNHGASVLLKNQKVVFSVFDDEQYYKNKYFVQGASMTSDSVSQSACLTLINDIEKSHHNYNLLTDYFMCSLS